MSKKRSKSESLSLPAILGLTAGALLLFCVCVSAGSVSIPLRTTVDILIRALTRSGQTETLYASILLDLRLPRVLSAALMGAGLSVAGASMQGLLKNPLADGTTLGVSAGASLGAVLSIAFGITFPALPFSGTAVTATLFAFGSLVIILALAYRLDYSLSTNTIILIGVIYSMFASSAMSIVITFAPDKLKSITFWTMGSLASATYRSVGILFVTLLLGGGILFGRARELNAFAIGEDNARHIGINVRRVKLTVLVCVSVLIGICVSIGGTIGFVGLVTPHMCRMITGPNHKKLLPVSMFAGAGFLMLADLVARTAFSPIELPIGVVTSLVGALVFLYIFYTTGRRNSRA